MLPRTNHSTMKLLLSEVLFHPFSSSSPFLHLFLPPMFYSEQLIIPITITLRRTELFSFLLVTSPQLVQCNLDVAKGFCKLTFSSKPHRHKLWQIRMNCWIITEWNRILKTSSKNVLSHKYTVWKLNQREITWCDGIYSILTLLNSWAWRWKLFKWLYSSRLIESNSAPAPRHHSSDSLLWSQSAISHNFQRRRFQRLGINIQFSKNIVSNPRDAQPCLKS